MPSETAHRLSAYVIALGAMFTLAAALVSGPQTAVSTGIGALMAVANWYLLKWIVTRVVEGDTTRKAGFLGMLFLKMGGFMAAVYALLALRIVTPIAFTFGLSALAGGLLIGSFLYVIGNTPVESEH